MKILSPRQLIDLRGGTKEAANFYSKKMRRRKPYTEQAIRWWIYRGRVAQHVADWELRNNKIIVITANVKEVENE